MLLTGLKVPNPTRDVVSPVRLVVASPRDPPPNKLSVANRESIQLPPRRPKNNKRRPTMRAAKWRKALEQWLALTTPVAT